MIGSDEKDFIRGGFKADIRSDGRACNDSRPLSLSLGDLQPCSGSARCTLVVDGRHCWREGAYEHEHHPITLMYPGSMQVMIT